MRDLVVIGVVDRQRVDEIALTFGLSADRLRLLDGGKAERKIGGGRWVMWIVKQAQRDAPVRDAAFGIGLECLLEDLLGFAVPERMLVAHGAVEASLRGLVARGREMDVAEPRVGLVLAERRLAA